MVTVRAASVASGSPASAWVREQPPPRVVRPKSATTRKRLSLRIITKPPFYSRLIYVRPAHRYLGPGPNLPTVDRSLQAATLIPWPNRRNVGWSHAWNFRRKSLAILWPIDRLVLIM